MTTPDMNEELRKLLDLRAEADVADEKAKAAKRKRDSQEALVLEMMEERGFGVGDGSLTLNLGGGYGKVQFVPNRTLYSKIFHEEDFLAWARETGREEEFFSEKPRKKPLNDLVKAALEDQDGGTEIPPGVDFSETRYVTVTKR